MIEANNTLNTTYNNLKINKHSCKNPSLYESLDIIPLMKSTFYLLLYLVIPNSHILNIWRKSFVHGPWKAQELKKANN
jgi:hypothetical protein